MNKKRATTNTLRLSRSCLIPSNHATIMTNNPGWIKTTNLEKVIRAALGVEGIVEENDWNIHLMSLGTQEERSKMKSCASRRKRICSYIVEQVYRNHVIKNAFFGLEFLNKEFGIFGHTPTDVMHCLEEGIMKYVQKITLDLLPSSIRSQLDQFVNSFLAKTRNHGMRLFCRCNFSKGFTSLSYLSSEETVGVILALVII